MKLYGAGTPDDPYLIGSNDDLNKIRTGISNRYVSSSTCYSQQNNIDMTGYNDKCGWEGNWYQIGQSATYPFTGYYYGNGYSIKNMTLKDPNKIAASLFGYVNKAVIMDLTIQNADITGYCAVSAIAGAIVTSGSGQDPPFIKGCPVGLGEPEFDKLHAQLGAAMLGINAVKGFEYGEGFDGVTARGSQQNDTFVPGITTATNHSGGIQGGISNGQDIYFRVAFKPVATILKEQDTADLEGNATKLTARGRHDPCVLPRAVPVVEAMAAMVILDSYLVNKSVKL